MRHSDKNNNKEYNSSNIINMIFITNKLHLKDNIIVRSMVEYQKTNNITGMCLTNALYLKDSLIASQVPAKVKSCFACYKNEKIRAIVVHMVVQLHDDTLIDPSYEICCQNPKYFDKYHMALSYMSFNKSFTKKVLEDYLHFVSLSEKINQGEILISRGDKDYYYNQADYVELQLNT